MGRIGCAQNPVDIEKTLIIICGKLLAEHDLKNIACFDILLALFYHRHIVFLIHVRYHLAKLGRYELRISSGLFQHLLYLLDFPFGFTIVDFHMVCLHIDNDEYFLFQVVKRYYFIE
ncbi:hypothetical protein SDC9_193969 [bioreactor metagenome]|uniref:Uncharacterized protein n=1 Tax=bioreactor metagenome TaxID=1076179 RepID=A0A645IG93_9ZZZZ